MLIRLIPLTPQSATSRNTLLFSFISGAAALFQRLPHLRGRGAIAERLAVAGARRGGSNLWKIRMAAGHTMRAPASSFQSWSPAFTGEYEDAVLEHIEPLIEPGSIAVDVGACFGFYTVRLAMTAAQRGASVLAVEPVPANREVLVQNLALNGVSPVVTVLAMALGAGPGTARLLVEHGKVGNAAVEAAGVDRDAYAALRAGVEEVDVAVARLDDLLEEQGPGGRCSFLKLDVEGYESSVLAGASRTVRTCRPAILAEFGEQWLDLRGIDRNAPFAWAADNDYRCLDIRLYRRSKWSDRRAVEAVEVRTASDRSGLALLLLPR